MLSSRMSAQDEEDVLAELAELQAEQVQVSSAVLYILPTVSSDLGVVLLVGQAC